MSFCVAISRKRGCSNLNIYSCFLCVCLMSLPHYGMVWSVIVALPYHTYLLFETIISLATGEGMIKYIENNNYNE